jgi:anti-sigma28 factor (negative regulator of flagellin synthesis)
MKVKDTPEVAPPRPAAQQPSQIAQVISLPVARAPDTVSSADSTAVRELARTSQAAMAQGREARLQELTAAVRQGTYWPSPQQVASRLLDDSEVTASLLAMMRR